MTDLIRHAALLEKLRRLRIEAERERGGEERERERIKKIRGWQRGEEKGKERGVKGSI